MAGVMFDTNAFNRLLDTTVDPGTLASGRSLYATHIQLNELSATRDPVRAKALTDVFHKTPQKVIPTAAAVWDVSEFDGAEYGDAGGAYPEIVARLDAANGGKRNNCQDALIGATVLKNGLTLVTNDRDLATVLKEMGGSATTFEEFIGHAG
jgi:predicted nucleic acid-binding protein